MTGFIIDVISPKNMGIYMEDHPRTCKWLGSPPIYKPWSERPFIRGITLLRKLTITMVINQLLNGMILQVVINGATGAPINGRKYMGNWRYNPYNYLNGVTTLPAMGDATTKPQLSNVQSPADIPYFRCTDWFMTGSL